MRRITCWILLLLGAQLAGADDASVAPRSAVGWRLFFDPLLSRPGSLSCASCHQPARGFADGLPRARGAYGDLLPRHTPRLANLAAGEAFFWDGRAGSLEEQALVPLTHPLEMDLTVPEIVARVAGTPDYRQAFAAIGASDISIDDVVGAIAAFVRSLRTGETAFDRWLDGESEALDAAGERGRMIFFTRGQCATCHLGDDLTDHRFHNIGTGTVADPGRFEATGEEPDRGRFKTPSLRNWLGSAPFMHDGRFPTIRDVIDHYSDPPVAVAGESELDTLDLTAAERDDLMVFLETLNGPGPDPSRYAAAWEALLAGP